MTAIKENQNVVYHREAALQPLQAVVDSNTRRKQNVE